MTEVLLPLSGRKAEKAPEGQEPIFRIYKSVSIGLHKYDFSILNITSL